MIEPLNHQCPTCQVLPNHLCINDDGKTILGFHRNRHRAARLAAMSSPTDRPADALACLVADRVHISAGVGLIKYILEMPPSPEGDSTVPLFMPRVDPLVQALEMHMGTRYLDPPDGGEVPQLEQLNRFAAEAQKWREAEPLINRTIVALQTAITARKRLSLHHAAFDPLQDSLDDLLRLVAPPAKL